MDITFCSSKNKKGIECPKRESCKRYIYSLNQDFHNINQSWISNAPFIKKMDGVSCDLFLNIYKEND